MAGKCRCITTFRPRISINFLCCCFVTPVVIVVVMCLHQFAFGCNQAHAAICQNVSAFIRSHALDIGMMLGNFQAKIVYKSTKNMRGRSKEPTLGWLNMYYARFTLLLHSALRYTSLDCMCVFVCVFVLALTRDSSIFLVCWPLFFYIYVCWIVNDRLSVAIAR